MIESIPLSGSVALTNRCNLNCLHCYIGDKKHQSRSASSEISTLRWLQLIDEITESGCINLLITGGEPLLRSDFREIYLQAKKNGLLVTVFTNGTLFSDEIIQLLCDYPPRMVEISLYGATDEVYEKITQVAGSFEKCKAGIQQLINAQINLGLKTILMSCNEEEFFEIEEFAEKNDLKFRFDPAIFPCFTGDNSPLKLRVDPRRAIDIEFSDYRRAQAWKNHYEKIRDKQDSRTDYTNGLYTCGAGRSCFHINPFGDLQPCLMSEIITCSLVNKKFPDIWKQINVEIKKIKSSDSNKCRKCELKTLCGYCPPFSKIENGDENLTSPYLCELGKARFEKIAALEEA